MKYFNETYIKRKFITRNEWADTYRAIHSSTEEKVILKVLVRKSNDEEYIKNLSKEVEILKNIKNTNLINVNNMFQYSGCGKTYYYIEGEYFKGISFEEKLVNEKLDEQQAVEIVENISKGIKEFHDRKISFNDLNLKNIFINSKDIVKVDVLSYLENKDFIILSDEEEGKIIEDPIFNAEKDICDLGSVLYSLLTGKITFNSSNYKSQISNENLVSIIEKATNLDLESKYRNIDRFIEDLESYLKYGELSDTSYDLDNITTKKSKRKKNKLGKALGVCASVVIVGGVAIYGYDLLEKNKNEESSEITKVEESTKPKDESKEEDKTVEENKEDKAEEDKTTTSDKKDNESSKNTSSTTNSNKNNSNKNNSNSNSNKNNNSSGTSNSNSSSSNSSNSSNQNSNSNNNSSGNNSNSNSSTNKPSTNGSSDSTTNKPDEGNSSEEQTPEVTPPSNDNANSENTIPEAPSTEAESE